MKLHEWLSRALRAPVVKTTGRLLCLEPADLEGERLTGRLSAINKWSRRDLKLEDVRVYGMNGANDVIDYYDSRFTTRGLKEVAKAWPGSAMARGHYMGGAPLARVFEADTLMHESASEERGKARELRDLAKASWARGLFYFSRAMSFAPDLAEAIETGLEREVSLHWQFTRALCSECGNDVRSMECTHIPGEEYDGRRAWYEMDGVTEVIETSFVLKGGQRGTSLFGGDALDQAASFEFGRAIREVKTDRVAWDQWRKLAPSASRNGDRRLSVRDWFGSALGSRA